MSNGKFAGGNGSTENPYLIEDTFDLNAVRNNLNASYKVIKNIDLNIAPFNTGNGWTPIPTFEGIFDGDGKFIDNLYINNVSTTGYIGLFSINQGNIKNVGIKNANITYSGAYTATLSGSVSSKGIIENCCTIGGKVTGSTHSGALVGDVWTGGTIKNCYSNTEVVQYDGNDAGGLIGEIGCDDSKMINCYSYGKCSYTNGGLIGAVTSGYEIKNSYWDINSSGQKNSTGGEGKTTEEMKHTSTFIDWKNEKLENGKPIWILKEGTYPKLWFEESNKYLIKQNNHLYTIKSSYYNEKNIDSKLIKLNDDEINDKSKMIDDLSDIDIKNLDSSLSYDIIRFLY